jgi:hypothetical protein
VDGNARRIQFPDSALDFRGEFHQFLQQLQFLRISEKCKIGIVQI